MLCGNNLKWFAKLVKQFRCFVALPVHLLQREQFDCIDWFAMSQMAFDPFVQEVVVFPMKSYSNQCCLYPSCTSKYALASFVAGGFTLLATLIFKFQ